MILLVSGATATLRELPADRLGYLVVPGSWGLPDFDGRPWAADNGAFSGLDVEAFEAMLAKLAGRPGCRFVAAPDVVGDAAATLALYQEWQPRISGLGFPVALVAQDGLTPSAVPWAVVDAIFIGGSTDWKLGAEARAVAAEARARGKWLHMGRVNTKRRLRYAALIGCDSIDGSRFSKWSKKAIPMALAWMRRHRHQGELEL